jgi:hypothetical protein
MSEKITRKIGSRRLRSSNIPKFCKSHIPKFCKSHIPKFCKSHGMLKNLQYLFDLNKANAMDVDEEVKRLTKDLPIELLPQVFEETNIPNLRSQLHLQNCFREMVSLERLKFSCYRKRVQL